MFCGVMDMRRGFALTVALLVSLAPISGAIQISDSDVAGLEVDSHGVGIAMKDAPTLSPDRLAAAREATARRMADKKLRMLQERPGTPAQSHQQPKANPVRKAEPVQQLARVLRKETIKEAADPDDDSEKSDDGGKDASKKDSDKDVWGEDDDKPTTTVESWDADLKDNKFGTANFTKGYEHTLGHQKNNIMGLPGWAAVLVAGASAALIMICFISIGNRLAHPLPFFAKGEPLMKDRILQAREKVQALEAAVERKKAQEQFEKDEAARKEREAIEGPKPAVAHDELVGEMLYRTQEVQRQAVGAVNDSIKQAAPLLARASHVQNVFRQSAASIQDRAQQMALKEAADLYSKMKKAIDNDDGQSPAELGMNQAVNMANGGLPDWLQFGEEDTTEGDPPPFTLLLSGMFAPAQLKFTRSNCLSTISWNSMMLAICTACLTIDHRQSCPDQMVWAWIYGMLILNALDVICCSCIAARCATAIGSLQDAEDATGRIKPTGNVIWDSYILLQANSGHFFKAYFAYQSVTESWVYTVQKQLTLVATVWGGYGMWITVQDIVQDTLSCDAKIILWFLHTYSFFFLLFLTWNSLALVLWVLKKLSGLSCVSGPFLKMAKKSDDEVPFKMPVFQTLTRAFLLRDTNTMLVLKAEQLADEVTSLEKEIEDTKTKMEQRKSYLEQLERSRINAQKKEKLLTEKYKAKVLASGGTLPGIAPESGAASSSAGPSSSGTVWLGADGQAAAAPAGAAGMAQSLLSAQAPTGGAEMAQSFMSGASSYGQQLQAQATSAASQAQSAYDGAGSSSGATVAPPQFSGVEEPAAPGASSSSASLGSGSADAPADGQA